VEWLQRRGASFATLVFRLSTGHVVHDRMVPAPAHRPRAVVLWRVEGRPQVGLPRRCYGLRP
jgi:hypothetical protein